MFATTTKKKKRRVEMCKSGRRNREKKNIKETKEEKCKEKIGKKNTKIL